MAKTRTIMVAAPRRAAPSINLNMPRGAIRRGGARVARAGAAAAQAEKHTLAAIGAAAALGYMSRTGEANLPHINALGVPGTYGVALWGIGKMMKSRTASHMATGLLSIAAYEMVRTGAIGGSGGGGAGGAAMRGML